MSKLIGCFHAIMKNFKPQKLYWAIIIGDLLEQKPES